MYPLGEVHRAPSFWQHGSPHHEDRNMGIKEHLNTPYGAFLCMIKDAIANIARNREVLHFLSCIARFLGHFSGLPTTRPSDFPERDFWPASMSRCPGIGRAALTATGHPQCGD